MTQQKEAVSKGTVFFFIKGISFQVQVNLTYYYIYIIC